jgi:carboxypeptidase family protein
MERFGWTPRRLSLRWKLPLQLVVTLFVFLYSIHDSRAQTTTSGGLMGVVTDPSNALVPDAVVELRDSAKGSIQSAKTDGYGVYRFFFLAPGRYTLTMTRAGFRTESRKINVLLGPPVTLNLTLEIAKENATVKVTGEAPLIQAENGDVSTTMNQLQISEVPNPGNDLTYIAQTAPGAIMNTDGIGFGGSGNFSILGMPGSSNLFTLNGMNDNNSIEHHYNSDLIQSNTNNSGVLGMMLGQNEIQEATVVSNGYSGQFGGAAGTSINYLTKSGTDAFHGNGRCGSQSTIQEQFLWNDLFGARGASWSCGSLRKGRGHSCVTGSMPTGASAGRWFSQPRCAFCADRLRNRVQYRAFGRIRGVRWSLGNFCPRPQPFSRTGLL